MNRQAQAVVLLLFGGAVLRATLTDMHLRYVKAGLTPFLVAAGVVLLIAGVMTLIHDLRPPRAAARPQAKREPDHGHAPGHDGHAHDGHAPGHDGHAHDGHAHDQDDHGHDHDGGHHEPRVGWLLILPVLGLLLVAPPALGSDAAGRTGTALSSQGNSNFPPLPQGDPAKITVLDYASRAYFDKGVSLNGRSVELTGFVAKGPEDSQVLARIILSCCAADGRPIKIGMEGNPPDGLAENTWIRVVGKYSQRIAKDPVNGETIPYLDVETWEQIDPPKQQYE